jgi:hypothetical protein
VKTFAKLFLLLLVALLGFGFGLIRTLNNENPPLTPLAESLRPAKLAELPKALDAFFANTNATTHMAARQAVIDYRRTFPDMSPNTLQSKADDIFCADKFNPECRIMGERANRLNDELSQEVALRYYKDHSKYSPETIKKFIRDATLERRFHGNVALFYIDEARKKLESEKALASSRERFFQQIDKAVTDTTIKEIDLQEFLKLYATAAEKSMHNLRRGSQCNQQQEWAVDIQLCSKAVQTINNMRAQRERASKAETLKQVITERHATFEQLQQAVRSFFQ